MIAKIKIGTVVLPRWFIPGYPLGISADTAVVVREVKKDRLRVERDDGRQGSWWVNLEAVRRFGDHA